MVPDQGRSLLKMFSPLHCFYYLHCAPQPQRTHAAALHLGLLAPDASADGASLLRTLKHRFNSPIVSERPECLLNRNFKVATFALTSLIKMLLDLQMSAGIYLSEYAFERAGTGLVHAGRRAQHACLPSRLLRHNVCR